MTFRDVDRYYERFNDPWVAEFFARNPHAKEWHERYPPTLWLVPIWKLPTVLIRMARGRRA
ncbi:MAG: hypothetical protein HYR51_12620 [Candidatus Rokubacteria bacterium]|nr:hypothetical protein [Candidatus Rokubacteria bacterium]